MTGDLKPMERPRRAVTTTSEPGRLLTAIAAVLALGVGGVAVSPVQAYAGCTTAQTSRWTATTSCGDSDPAPKKKSKSTVLQRVEVGGVILWVPSGCRQPRSTGRRSSRVSRRPAVSRAEREGAEPPSEVA